MNTKFNPLTHTYDTPDGTKVASELGDNVQCLADVLHMSAIREKQRSEKAEQDNSPLKQFLAEADKAGVTHLNITQQAPVLIVEQERDYFSRGHFHHGTRAYIDPTKVWKLPIGTKLYTSPQPAQRQPLTEEKIIELNDAAFDKFMTQDARAIELARSIEAAHHIKLN